MEDLIAQEDVVVTITRTGYAKRTKTDLYRAQRRGGKGVQGANLRTDDIVEHFFVSSTHDWILFFTNKGRVYRAKAYELPEANRNARGQHVANLLAFQPDEQIANVIALKNYEVAPYLVLATKHGLVKKSELTLFDSNRSGGIVAINLREDDELIGAALISSDDDLLLVSRKAMSIRFRADDETLRPMGRATSGVFGMRFNKGDELLSMSVVRDELPTSKSWSQLRAATPNGPGSTSIRYRAAAARACSPRVSFPRGAGWSVPSQCRPRTRSSRSRPTAWSSARRPRRSAARNGRPWAYA